MKFKKNKFKKSILFPSLFLIPIVFTPIVVSCSSTNDRDVQQIPNIPDEDIDKTIDDVNDVVFEYNQNAISLKANDLGKQIAANSVNKSNIDKYVDNLPKKQYENGTKTEIVQTLAKNANILTAYIKFYKNYPNSTASYSKTQKYDIRGFNSYSDFENRVNSISLSIKSTSQNVIYANEVNLDNIKKHVNGIPNSTSNFKVSLNNIETYVNEGKIIVTIDYSDNDSNFISKQYTVTGFKIPENFMNKVNAVTLSAKSTASSITADKLTKENINTYISGIPESTDTFNVEITIDYINPTYTSENAQRTYTVTGFKLPSDFMDKVNDVNLSANTNASTITADQVNTSNVSNYVNGIPSSSNNFKVTITNVETDRYAGSIVVHINFSNPQDSSENVNKSYTVTGFKVPENFMNKVDAVTLSAKSTANTITASEINVANITQYVSGIPQSTDTFKVTISKIIPNNSSGSIQVTIDYINPTYTSENAQRTYTVTGFKLPSDFMDKVNNVSLSANDNARTITADQVNKSNVSNYVNGIPSSSNNFKVTITNIETDRYAGSIVVHINFSNPQDSSENVNKSLKPTRLK